MKNILEDPRVDQFTFVDSGYLPGWATGVIPLAVEGIARYRVIGAQLATRDGRRHGNACVVNIQGRFLHLITDMGSPMVLTETEAEREFYLPIWTMSPQRFLDLNAMRKP